MKKYRLPVITILILLVVVFTVIKWTKWDTVLLLVLCFAVAGVILYRSFKKEKKES